MKAWMAALLALTALVAQAQETSSRIARVTLYPGRATVERELRVAAGAGRVELACLPAGIDASSLRVDGGSGVRVGEIAIDTVERAQGGRCRQGGVEDRIRALEDERAVFESESQANELALGVMKQFGGGESRVAAPDARLLPATVDAVRRQATELFARQQRLKRSMEALDRQLEPLRAERERSPQAAAQWRTVRFALQADKPGLLRVSYDVAQAGWTPAYRATLDSRGRTVALERQALIAQHSGEDWSGVAMTLSTGQPRRAPEAPQPWPWELRPEVSMEAGLRRRESFALAQAAPAPAEASVAKDASFDIGVFEGVYATEFALPGPVDLRSDGQRISVNLSHESLPVTLRVRSTPQLDASAYLVAEAARPAGVWPAGPLQLVRDGAVVGTTAWRPADGERLALPFGVDERVRVEVQGPKAFDASSGFIGSRIERQIERAYVVHNAHEAPIELQVLEAAPVPATDQISVRTRFEPQPAVKDWEHRQGVVAWQMPVAAGQSVRLSAAYAIGYPKELRVSGLH